MPECDAVIAAVAHKEYLDKPFGDLTARLKKGGVFTDVKSAYDPDAVTGAGFKLWRL
jgi:UDP-N-acetyl-D-galactosamine dehydrogenase